MSGSEKREAAGMHTSGTRSGSCTRRLRLAILGVGLYACAMGSAQGAMAATALCPNEEFRTGPAASLPDCRAYELVTPEDLGRTQSMTFTGSDLAVPSVDGEHLALDTLVPIGPNPSLLGTRAVFSRTAQGWATSSMVEPGAGAQEFNIELLSPDLSQVALESTTQLNYEETLSATRFFEVGPVGGPYKLVAEAPSGHEYATYFSGANAGIPDVPAFTHVILESTDHQLLQPGPERTRAEETVPGAKNLYDLTSGALYLVNVEGEGSRLKLIGTCGARLGDGHAEPAGANTLGAVSADGSKVFFTVPDPDAVNRGIGCWNGGTSNPPRLYVQEAERDPSGVVTHKVVEVSAPSAGVQLSSSERKPAYYNVASADGSEVVFQTATPLLKGEGSQENKLFMYNTVTRVLTLISNNSIPLTRGTGGRFVLLSSDGTTVYYEANERLYRYDTQTGATNFIAAIAIPARYNEPSYMTPNGQFLMFASGPTTEGIEIMGPHGPEHEPRGAGHNELYRYDVADGSVMCVSCGEGIAPTEGEMFESIAALENQTDETPPFVQMSEDGQRVFFETTARLVPQDTNSTTAIGSSRNKYPGMDVYEWEASGAEEAPGIFCHVVVGCTHLLSTGENVGKSTFLGASEDGSNVFLATEAPLVPQATPEFPNIYDARVDGGFAPPPIPLPCLSCQGVGSTAPLFGPGASLTFAGAGNPPLSTTTLKCPKGKRKSHGKCVKVKKRKVKARRALRGLGGRS